MTATTRSLLSACTLLLGWELLGKCESEEELRIALMGAFSHTREAHLSLILMPEADPPKGFNKRLDLYLLPSWPPRQEAVAAGEIKFFREGKATDYRTRIGSRLSDLHYVHCLADITRLHGFFLDLVLNPKLVGKECYDSLRTMCQVAADALYRDENPISPDQLKNAAGVKAFATACIDHTPRQLLRRLKFGFLFPPMDLPGGSGRHKRGPAFVKSPGAEGLIALGVRQSGKEQITPYRAVRISGQIDCAVCFAVFEPGGSLAATTDDLVTSLAKW